VSPGTPNVAPRPIPVIHSGTGSSAPRDATALTDQVAVAHWPRCTTVGPSALGRMSTSKMPVGT
jgi:hypothetical protein